MSNFTTDTQEMKRKIVLFSNKLTKGQPKPTQKFVLDMMYGIAASGSVKISEISRVLQEDIKLRNTIERLCDNLSNMSDKAVDDIKTEHISYVKKKISGDNPICLLDDTDITKRHGRKFEDLDIVIDASNDKKEKVKVYHVCEAVMLTQDMKHPISVYSKIYSCKSDGFISKNNYTLESIYKAASLSKNPVTFVADRLYDAMVFYNAIEKVGGKFVIRLKDNRNFLFKNKEKNVGKEALKRKGKVHMDLMFNGADKIEIAVSHTRVKMPSNKKEYTVVFVYGLSTDKPMKLLTSKTIKCKADVIKVVRLYFSRWKIEEYFKTKKQNYGFEDMRVRTLKAMNVLNDMLTYLMTLIAAIVEDIDKKLLCIKIIERSKSLKNKVVFWMNQCARGIKEILSYARCGVKGYQDIEERPKCKQLSLF